VGVAVTPMQIKSRDYRHFAYGSNLKVERKQARTGPIREALIARLPDFRFAFNKRGKDGSGKANILPTAGSEVWGIVYRISAEGLSKLDRFEGVPDHYTREDLVVVLESGEKITAVTYTARPHRIEEGLKPTPDYLELILEGAKHHGLPGWYIKKIEELA